ncbi:MAG: dihydropteroate synthase DHPS [Rhodospirillaceae bacterium]|nr:dihydropteroate synthase DHPS [Rhodospirillaceae bacterium]
MAIPELTIIGERINPGFKSTKEMFDNSNIDAIQALAVKQAEAGAVYLNINIGTRALDDHDFMEEVIEAIQAVVDIPLSFDFPNVEVQELCLNTYDEDKAGGQKPIVNSISETRWDMMEVLKIRPCKVILMSSEYVDDGEDKQCETAGEMFAVTKKMTNALLENGHVTIDDIIVDIAIGTLSSDTKGLTRNSLATVKMINEDTELKGIHMSGGLSNLPVQLPAKEIEGQPMKLQLENAFLTLAVPNGFDMVLGTPWRDYNFLPEDNQVLKDFQEIIAFDGLDALRRLRKLYAG